MELLLFGEAWHEGFQFVQIKILDRLQAGEKTLKLGVDSLDMSRIRLEAGISGNTRESFFAPE
jgi:hypothetical protein